MTKEDLVKLYRTWDDEKLLDTFQKRADYTPVAGEAMLQVIDERKLAGGSASLLQKETEKMERMEAFRAEELIEKQRLYEAQMIREDLTTAELVRQSKSTDGVYFSTQLGSHGKKSFGMFLIIFSLVAFIFSFILFSDKAALPGTILAVMAVLTTFFGIGRIKQSTVSFQLREDEKKTSAVLSNQAFSFKAEIPFNYFHFWSEVEIRGKGVRIVHPMLSLVITNRSGETIVLQCNLTALQDAPPSWPQNLEHKIPKNARFFSELPFKPYNMVRLKKLIDGLHESHSN